MNTTKICHADNLSKVCYKIVAKRKQAIIFMIAAFSISSMDKTFVPYMMKVIIDKAQANEGDRVHFVNKIWIDLIITSVAIILLELLQRIKGVVEACVMPDLKADIRIVMCEKMQRFSPRFLSGKKTGTLINCLASVPNSIGELIIMIIEVYTPVLTSAVISIFLTLRINVFMGLSLGLWIIIHSAITFFFAEECANRSFKHSSSLNELQGAVTDSMLNIDNVTLFGRMHSEIKLISKAQREEVIKFRSMMLYMEKTKIFLGVLATTEYLGMLVAAIFLWQKSLIEIGDLVLVFSLTSNMMMLAWMLSLEAPYFFQHLGVCRQASDAIENGIKSDRDVYSDYSENECIDDISNIKGAISFSKVKFGYSKSTLIFKNLDVEIQPMQRVALIGESGAGKSTFCKLVMRYCLPHDGDILIDGIDIRQISSASLSRIITAVPQKITLFNRSIEDNIRCANADATREDMIRVSKEVGTHDFIVKMPQGYDTIIGEEGTMISEGQKQLMGIARAAIRNSPILLLDEPTASLDYVTEKRIKRSLDTLMAGKTVLMVAHRLHSVIHMDRILVFADGGLLADGSHEELIENCCFYAKMWYTQSTKDSLYDSV